MKEIEKMSKFTQKGLEREFRKQVEILTPVQCSEYRKVAKLYIDSVRESDPEFDYYDVNQKHFSMRMYAGEKAEGKMYRYSSEDYLRREDALEELINFFQGEVKPISPSAWEHLKSVLQQILQLDTLEEFESRYDSEEEEDDDDDQMELFFDSLENKRLPWYY